MADTVAEPQSSSRNGQAGITAVREGLSFDDVLLVPQRSDALPSEINASAELFDGIRLNAPIMSAPMDTVTEARLAIAMAREGGVGVVHRNMPIDVQADHVDRVKRSEHGIITNPIKLGPDATLEEANDLMGRFHISGVPIVDENDCLVGILTNRDIRFESDFSKKIRERMTSENLITSRPGVTLDDAQTLMAQHRIEKLPITDEEGHLKGLITIKDIEKVKRHPHATKDDKGRLVVGAAIGPLREPVERAKALHAAGVDFIVIDAAHGQSIGVLTALEKVKEALPDLRVIAGNVATADGVRDLHRRGADGIRIGIGAGSICTTRVVAGIGVPQFTAVLDCAAEARSLGLCSVADGGIRYSGDIVKCLAAGASCVMMGSMFAGCDESPGDTEIYRNRAYKVYRGMGSIGAMKKGSSDRYFQLKEAGKTLVPEGVEGRVPYKGPLSETMAQLMGGLRSGMGYCGAHSMDDLREGAEFMRITGAGLRESHPHDVWITKEPPNYSAPHAGGSGE